MAKKQKTGGWRVLSAEFETSATGLSDFPRAPLPEFAVGGRSNVGKSSLLNAFASRRGLARVSKSPGRTRLLNCFQIRLAAPDGTPTPIRWVDLPGYGFAAAHRAVRDSFGPMIESYLGKREELRAFVLLVDARRGLQTPEFEMLEFMSSRQCPTLIGATKVDKLNASERGLVARKLAKELDVDPRDILLTSSTSGAGLGDEGRAGGLARELGEMARVEVGAAAEAGSTAPEAPA